MITENTEGMESTNKAMYIYKYMYPFLYLLCYTVDKLYTWIIQYHGNETVP